MVAERGMTGEDGTDRTGVLRRFLRPLFDDRKDATLPRRLPLLNGAGAGAGAGL